VIQITSALERLHLIKMLISGASSLVDLIFPPNCLVCRTSVEGEAAICDKCLCYVGLPIGERCQRCGCPGEKALNCANCTGKHFSFHRLITLGDFNEEVRRLVHAVKYQGRSRVALVLGNALGDVVLDSCTLPSSMVVVPVPLHPSRERDRGYNQSGLIAKSLARTIERPVLQRVLRRSIATNSQTALDHSGREENVRGVFE
jgi:competence protein ComFC